MKKNKSLLGILLCAVLLLAGCSNIALERDAIIASDVTKVGIMHIKNDEMTQWTISGDDIEQLRDWASKLTCVPYKFEAGKSPKETGEGEFYDFFLAKGKYRNLTYVIKDADHNYIYFADGWYSITNPTTLPIKEPTSLTLKKVMELASKGDALTWTDFEQYKGTVINSQDYILLYPIDENYNLLVSGIPDEKPAYIR